MIRHVELCSSYDLDARRDDYNCVIKLSRLLHEKGIIVNEPFTAYYDAALNRLVVEQEIISPESVAKRDQESAGSPPPVRLHDEALVLPVL